MYYFDRKAVIQSHPSSISGGPTTYLIENLGAAFTSERGTDIIQSSDINYREAREEQIKKAEDISGMSRQEIFSKYGRPPTPMLPGETMRESRAPLREKAEDEAIKRLKEDLGQSEEQGSILTGDQLWRRAEEIAMEKVIRAEEIFSRADGTGAGIGQFLGVMGAQMTDPLVLSTLPIGPAAGARLATMVAINSAVAAAVTTAQQPIVQKWRERLGLPHGVDVAMRNIAAGSAGAGALTFVLGAFAKGLGKLGARAQLEAFDDFIPNPRPDQIADRIELEAEARFQESNPFKAEKDSIMHSVNADLEHRRAAALVNRALENDDPLPELGVRSKNLRANDVPNEIEQYKLLEDPASPRSIQEADKLQQSFRARIDDSGDYQHLIGETDSGEPITRSASDFFDEFDEDTRFLKEIENCR